MHPILYDFGFYPLRTYGLMLAIGFLTALIFCRHASRHTNIQPALVSDMFIWILGCGIIGARLLYVIIHTEEFGNPLAVFFIWKGGLVYYGGFLGGLLGCFLFARRNKIRFLSLVDLSLPAVMLGQSIGRWGCLMAGCCYGKEVDADHPFGIAYPASEYSLIPMKLQNPDMENPVHFLHPTQIYNSINAFLIFLVLWLVLRQSKRRGLVTAVFLILYSITRSCLETFRGDFAERGNFGPLSTSQWISVFLGSLGLYLFFRSRKEQAKEAGPSRKKP